MENPNSVFCKMFAWFVTKYGCTSAEDCATNHNAMALDWHPLQGFELLVARLFCGATFANLAKYPIPDDNIVDIGIRVLHRTGLFAKKYKAWITHGNDPTNSMSFAAFRAFWETAVNIAAFAATPALQHGLTHSQAYSSVPLEIAAVLLQIQNGTLAAASALMMLLGKEKGGSPQG